ncbi:MAG: peptidase [Frankiales bacterium]|nr:peptidase [Frankiales bacterium]
MTLLGILAFVVALLVSVMLHEAGHFLTARHYGMKATQFFVGFGPTIWSRHKGETEYGVKAIPAGGFVKIIGMTPIEQVEPGDEDRAFFKQKPGRKTVVLAAGSTVHFIITIVLLFGTVLALGVSDTKTPTLASSQACIPLRIDSTTTVVDTTVDKKTGACRAGQVASPAAAAGLSEGDKVLSANGKAVTDYLGFRKLVRGSAGRPLTLVVQRDGKTRTLTVTPVATQRPDLTDETKVVTVGTVGIGQDPFVLKHVGLGEAFSQTGSQLKLLVTGTFDTITKKLGTIGSVYDKNRDPTGFVGVVGVSRVSGEIASAHIPFVNKLYGGLLLVAGLNLFVGIFNLLPLLPLDGGHIAVVWFEAVRDRVKRARGYVGDVVRVDYNRLMPLTFAVVILFAGFSLWLLGADIVNPIKLNQ